MGKAKTTVMFINEAKTKHGNKYDYSLVEYRANNENIKIICPTHGIIEQQPIVHLKSAGCPSCGRRKTQEQFIKDAKEIHGGKYDYSLADYNRSCQKIKIICKEHGVFEQQANAHLSGSGCSKCKYINLKMKYILGQEEFIKRLKAKHENKFDYSNVIYDGMVEKIQLKCLQHNYVFFVRGQSALINDFLCPKCVNAKSKGEMAIASYLDDNDIIYEMQKTFPDCRNFKTNALLRFDFHLPKYNLCIEFDGIFHYEEQKFGIANLIKIQLRDKIKTDFCKNNLIKLIRIPYWEKKNINIILKSKLKCH